MICIFDLLRENSSQKRTISKVKEEVKNDFSESPKIPEANCDQGDAVIDENEQKVEKKNLESSSTIAVMKNSSEDRNLKTDKSTSPPPTKRIKFDGNFQEISTIEDDDEEVIIIADNLVKDLADQSTDPKDADEIRKLLKQLSEKDHALDRCKHEVAKYKKVFSQLVNYMLKTGKKLGYDVPLPN